GNLGRGGNDSRPPGYTQSDTASSPGTIGRVLGKRPRRARLPTKPRIARNVASFSASPPRVCGTIFHISQSAGCAQQTAQTDPYKYRRSCPSPLVDAFTRGSRPSAPSSQIVPASGK